MTLPELGCGGERDAATGSRRENEMMESTRRGTMMRRYPEGDK